VVYGLWFVVYGLWFVVCGLCKEQQTKKQSYKQFLILHHPRCFHYISLLGFYHVNTCFELIADIYSLKRCYGQRLDESPLHIHYPYSHLFAIGTEYLQIE
jgi:hypothetical protein